MRMEAKERLDAFEAMLTGVQAQLADVEKRMAQLKAQGRERGATYRQLMGTRLQLAQMLELYRVYGLIGREG